ncbi:MAG TPA: glutamate--cysteine ligase [Prochlorococcaceae cyanobacterium AMR_MDS_5431]|nr:glutamate--cysteine ligase [Prochlorococcaceae cyanobacterium AMR_MDS_5431]
MNHPLLLKGFEVELFTGKPDGTVIGIASEAARALTGFVTEPDQRNLEYTTPPNASYDQQLILLVEPRLRLRNWLSDKGLTLLPGSTLSLGNSHRFERSNPDSLYHDIIELNYGTRVVTASVHINFGLDDMDLLFASCRLVRCEAALLLALSASSPFLDGEVCNAHSQRWKQFPLTPAEVPLFIDHENYINWMEAQLLVGSMYNERHLWTSVRPNGERRPYDINRLELRICDLVSDPKVLLAITAFLELRLLSLINNVEQYDPLLASKLSPTELAIMADINDQAAAQYSLDATLLNWRNGQSMLARDLINEILEEIQPLAQTYGLINVLKPLQDILQDGNQSIRWLKDINQGFSISEILSKEIARMAQQDETLSTILS